jgi:hypothetical protein
MSATDFQVFTKEGVLYYRENDQEDWKLLHMCKTCSEPMKHPDFEEGKMCCDKPLFHEDEDVEDAESWFDRKHPDAKCHRCLSKLNINTLVLCGGGGGACETWYCEDCYEEGTHDCYVCQEMEALQEECIVIGIHKK